MNSVDEYLTLLRKELSGSDSATIQDALADAEEYLRTALENAQKTQPGVQEAEALVKIVEEFGAPEEIAAAYRVIERRARPTLARSPQPESDRSIFVRFFGVIADPHAWGALLYMFFSLLTGILYFTWAVTGLSLSLGFIVLIIGLPFMLLFLLSVRGIALVEGRIVEALLGVQMPRRPIFENKNLGWWARLKALVTDRHTWMSLLYMILQLPLGIIYFTLFVTLIALALSFIAAPFLQNFLYLPIVNIDGIRYYLPMYAVYLLGLFGVFLVFATMHLAKLVGRLHGAMAKAMLVSE